MFSGKGETNQIYSLSNPEDLKEAEGDPNYFPPEAEELTEVIVKRPRKYSAAFSEETLDQNHWIINPNFEEFKDQFLSALQAENFNQFVQYVKIEVAGK